MSDSKRNEVLALHQKILEMLPNEKRWFFDGKNEDGKVVSNPNIGYGVQTIKYSNGKTKEFFRVSISPNASGISLFIMGLKDKNHLKNAYLKSLGKASITGYCIKFKSITHIDLDVLNNAIIDGFNPILTQ